VIHHISDKEVDESEDEDASPNPKPSIFDRLQSTTSTKCSSIFTSIWKGKIIKSLLLTELKMIRNQSLQFFLEQKLVKSLQTHNF